MNAFRRFAALLLAGLFLVCVIPIAALAEESGEDPIVRGARLSGGRAGSNITWTVYDDGLIYFQGKGKMSSVEDESRRWKYYSDLVTHAVFDDEITSILSDCFRDFAELESAVLPKKLRTIDFAAFKGCTSLEEVDLPEGLEIIDACAFNGCTQLKELVLPQSLKKLGYYSLVGTGLESITIPNGVTLDYGLFLGCSSLKTVKLPDSIEGTDYPYIGSYCFMNCTSLESIVLPAGTEKIYMRAFDGCTALKSITIPSSVVRISDNAFRSCTSLEEKNYNGSSAQWKSITKRTGNECLTAATLHTYYPYLPYSTHKPQYSVYKYTGNPRKPTVSVVTANGTTLKKGVNYTIEYKHNLYGDAEVVLTGIGKYHGTISYPFRVLPEKVTNVKCTSVTPNTATIEWTASPTAEKYCIFIGKTLMGETTDTTFTLTGLKSDHTRKVMVRAVVTGTDENGEPFECMSLANPIKVTTPKETKTIALPEMK